MHTNGIFRFSELTVPIYTRYSEFVATIEIDEDGESALLQRRLSALIGIGGRIFQQSVLFQTIPSMRLESDPLGGQSAHDRAAVMTSRTGDTIPPMPDEVYDPLIAASIEWVRNHAPDILALLEVYEHAVARTLDWASNNYGPYISRRLLEFRFNNGGKTHEWRPPLSEKNRVDYQDEDGAHSREVGPIEQLRMLLVDLFGAAMCLIQGTAAMRINEFAGLQAEPFERGMPSCLKMVDATTGNREAFYITGFIYKQKTKPQPAEWIIGIRPRGMDYQPDAVLAVEVLYRLFRYWRQLTGSDRLVLSVFRRRGLARTPKGVSAILSETLRRYQRRFMARNVELPPKFAGWVITTHQFRKKFAHDIIRSDASRIPEVRLHFHHLSKHVVSGAYYGNDAALIKLVDDTAVQEAARDIVSIVFGTTAYAGKTADVIRAQAEKIKSLCVECDQEADRVGVVAGALRSEAIKVWPDAHGDCHFRAETAACHLQALGFYDLTATKPNQSERNSGLCAGCFNLLVSSRSEPYWLNRRTEAEADVKSALDHDEPVTAHFARKRLKQADLILTDLQRRKS
ncbi:hypothetical protein [Agrobacterium sp. DSM 25558]|uniref:hypothetical protein n=1 Tax=Agrobacterium sp. DSM 25558 TaxID=1907665 RepID=UPI00097D91AF|nr:hypothetical protein [Agrobacterium sp. DSM 25558]